MSQKTLAESTLQLSQQLISSITNHHEHLDKALSAQRDGQLDKEMADEVAKGAQSRTYSPGWGMQNVCLIFN